MDANESMSIANWVVEFSVKNGAEQVAVSLTKRREVEIEYRDNKLEKLQESTKNLLNLKIYSWSRYSSHNTNDLRKETLSKWIEDALSGTKYLSEDCYRSLPDPEYYPKEANSDLQIYDPSYEQMQMNERKEMAAAVEKSALNESDQIISVTSVYNDTFTETNRVHSNGFSGQVKGTLFTSGAEVTVRDGETGRPSDGYWAHTRWRMDLPLPEELGREAARRALRKLGQSKIDSGRYTMLVENHLGAQLFTTLFKPMTAKNLQQKNSYLEDSLNKKVASESLTILDDPFIHKGLGSKYFDGEGLALKKRLIIENGILRDYYIDNYYGRKLALKPNSGSTSNIVFEYGTQSLEEMIREIDRGILITGFIGGNSNSTTGDFSYGIVGLLIEQGRVIQPVNEMNISGNAKNFWHSLIAVGSDPYQYSTWRCPCLRFEGVQFSGI